MGELLQGDLAVAVEIGGAGPQPLQQVVGEEAMGPLGVGARDLCGARGGEEDNAARGLNVRRRVMGGFYAS